MMPAGMRPLRRGLADVYLCAKGTETCLLRNMLPLGGHTICLGSANLLVLPRSFFWKMIEVDPRFFSIIVYRILTSENTVF